MPLITALCCHVRNTYSGQGCGFISFHDFLSLILRGRQEGCLLRLREARPSPICTQLVGGGGGHSVMVSSLLGGFDCSRRVFAQSPASKTPVQGTWSSASYITSQMQLRRFPSGLPESPSSYPTFQHFSPCMWCLVACLPPPIPTPDWGLLKGRAASG